MYCGPSLKCVEITLSLAFFACLGGFVIERFIIESGRDATPFYHIEFQLIFLDLVLLIKYNKNDQFTLCTRMKGGKEGR